LAAEAEIGAEAQIADVLVKFKTYGQQTPEVQEGLRQAS